MSFQAYNPATDTLTPIAENDYKDSLEKVSALPTASADLLNKCYLLTANQGSYIKGGIYQCQSDGSSGYTWILINGSGVPVDTVEDGNMNAVTSNAVSDKFDTLGTASQKDFTNFVSPTDNGLPISSSVFSAITSALYGAYHPSGSKTIAELDSSLLIQANVGNVYKITDSGVTTNLFIGGAGQTINVGDNAIVVYDSDGENFKYALQSGVVDLSEYQTKELPSGALIEDIIPTDASASNKLVTMADIIPVGVILPYGGTTAPNKWLFCQGQTVSRTTYSKLFAVIGDSFGAGDGSTTFNLPDMTGKTAMGVETGHAIGDSEDGALPNIKSNESQSLWAWNKSNSTGYNGALGVVTLDQGYHATTEGASGRFGTFVVDASKVSSIYTDGQTKVDPANVRVNYIIKAF